MQTSRLRSRHHKYGFLVIGGGYNEKKAKTLKNGSLEYKQSVIYLGVVSGDSGTLSKDVDAYLENKRSDVTIKYGNFYHSNYPTITDTIIILRHFQC